MNFIEQIIEAGFIEQGQQQLLEIMPHKEKWIPKWWQQYPYGQHWFGLSKDNPDAWFCKAGFDGVLQISLQGFQIPQPTKEEDNILMQNMSCRYICLMIGKEKIYESFSGKLPPDNIMNDFINASKNKI